MSGMTIGSAGQLIGGAASLAAAGGSIASGIQGKNAAEAALALQKAGLAQTGSLGNQSVALGLAQLDLQRQLADRQIDFANQTLTSTQPFRDRIVNSGPLTVGSVGGAGTPPIDPGFNVGGGPTNAGPNLSAISGTNRDAASDLLAAGQSPQQIAAWLRTRAPLDEVAAFLGGGGGAAPAGPSGTSGAMTLPDRTFSPVMFSQTPSERDTIEAQFRNARANTLANSPVRGGALGANLLNLEMGRAGAVVGLESDLSRRNQALENAAALTNFQTRLDNDRFAATDAINVRNMNFSSALADRNMAASIGFGAPSQALPALANAGQAFSPAAAGAVFGPALQASGATLGAASNNFAAANSQSVGSGQALGSLAAAGKLAGSKNAKTNNQTFGQAFGKA